MALLQLRATPIDSKLPSPSELLFNRTVRTTLPTGNKHEGQFEHVKEKMRERQTKQKHYHDKSATELKPLKLNQPVFLQDPIEKTWSPAQIIQRDAQPRSYWVKTQNGTIIRRNRIHLRERTIQNQNQPNYSVANPSSSPDSLHNSLSSDNHFSPPTALPTAQQHSAFENEKGGNNNNPNSVDDQRNPKATPSPGYHVAEPQRSSSPQSPRAQHQKPKQTVTRSGRVVKKPNKYNG